MESTEDMVNIPSYKVEANYRYKMPKMILRVEGRDPRTIIVNLSQISKALNVNTDCEKKKITLINLSKTYPKFLTH